jgi:serine phosphatase RsbU (regulator of sigma subunit)/anti-sigma regulatory factor (Ser/Thr protein kinase)
VVRRIRLPADRRTPAAARAVVRAVLAEAGLSDLLDEALLLTTELSTNGVLHAGTDIDLEVAAGADGLTVTVTDYGANHAALVQAGSDPVEGGRGLLLVDHFAASWGTTHQGKGKGVWFQLAAPGAVDDRPIPAPHQEPARQGEMFGEAPSAAALSSLVHIDLPEAGSGVLSPLANQLLSRLCAAVGAVGGTVRLDQADGRGMLPIAEYGMPVAPDTSDVRAALAVSWPWRGELVLVTPAAPGPYALPLTELTAERLGLAMENDRLRRTDLRRQAWLTFLSEASELLAQSLDVELTMALIPRLVVPRLGQWSAVYSLDEWSEPQLSSAAHADEAALPALLAELSQSGPDAPLARLREAVRSGVQVPLTAPVEGFAVPLVAPGGRLGALAVGRHLDHRQDPEEIAIAEDLARRAALALDNARIHAERRRVAQTLQQSLLPPALPIVAGIGLGAEYVPTQGDADVGGDFYDAVPMPDGRWLVVIGDVSGKGVQAATVTGLVRDVIRVLIRDGRPLPETLVRINETLVERGAGRYCTLAMAAIALDRDRRLQVNLHLAGHDRPVLVRADGKASYVGTPGTALGLLERVVTPSVPVALEPGDSLVFYTDGVTERRRGAELFGIERLRVAAGQLAGYGADVMAARLRAAAMNFSPESPRDDIAILAIRNNRS